MTHHTFTEWSSLRPADLEREYSPSSCEGVDIGHLLDEYSQASDDARGWCLRQRRPILTDAYGPLGSQTFDLVTPERERAPLIVFIHGGYWQELSKLESFGPAPDFVSQGIAYAALDYTLAPDATVDEIVVEVRQALTTIYNRADDLNIDADRIVVAGSSAGAHLAAMASLDPTSDWRPAGLVLLSGIYELEPLIATTINDALRLDVAAANRNSPARIKIADAPPTIVAWGSVETDQFKRQSHFFGRRLAAAGQPPTHIEVDGRNHFDILTDLGDMSTQLGSAVDRLIESTKENHANL
jgi:arylformamidase